MKFNLFLTAALALTAAISLPSHAQNSEAKAGNCAILAELSAQTVEKDSRFDGHDDIAPALIKFAEAQSAKLEAGMEETYAASKAYGWDKAKVDSIMAETDAAMRAGFFTSTMDKSKLYMDHVMALHGCGSAQTDPADLGQSPEAFMAVLQKMVQILRG